MNPDLPRHSALNRPVPAPGRVGPPSLPPGTAAQLDPTNATPGGRTPYRWWAAGREPGMNTAALLVSGHVCCVCAAAPS